MPNPSLLVSEAASLSNYTTAKDTRSLSIGSFPVDDLSGTDNITRNAALLLYENGSGNVSALLRRISLTAPPSTQVHWIDVTSQGTRSLPDEFRNTRATPNKTLYEIGRPSKTLYEFDTRITFSTPFTSYTVNSTLHVEFYSPSGSQFANGGCILGFTYETGESGPGIFGPGLCCRPLNETL